MTEQQSYSIRIIRVIATVMIFLCHTVYLFNGIIAKTAHFFDIAVSVFFFISAYLFSQKEKINGGVLNWYKNRAIRILIPYYFIIIPTLILNVVFGKNISISTWVTSLLAVSGLTGSYIDGTGHTWFITAILLCYLVTPILYKIAKKNTYIVSTVLLMLITYVPIAVFCKEIVLTYYFSVFEYILAFFFLKKIIIKLDKIKTVLSFVISCVILLSGMIMKSVANMYFDNTLIYSRCLVQICSLVIGFGIFSTLFYFSKLCYTSLKKLNRIISFFDGISYEFFLVHLVIIKGALSLLIFSSNILNIVFVFITSIVLGYIVNLISNGVIKWIKKD